MGPHFLEHMTLNMNPKPLYVWSGTIWLIITFLQLALFKGKEFKCPLLDSGVTHQVQEKYLNNQILICYFQNAFQQKQDRLILIGLTFLFDYLSAKIQCS